MTPPRALKFLILACSALGVAHPAAATATAGGSVSLVGGAGACNVAASVPLNTLQDNFLLSRATACAGTVSSAQIRGSAATASVGLRAASSGNGQGSSQVSAQVSLEDQWLISVPVGTPLGPLTLPVSLHLEGSISPAAVVGRPGLCVVGAARGREGAVAAQVACLRPWRGRFPGPQPLQRRGSGCRDVEARYQPPAFDLRGPPQRRFGRGPCGEATADRNV